MNQQSLNQTPSFVYSLCLVIALGIFLFSKDFPFFWDTVQLGAKHAYWYYDTNFAYFLLPENIDSGHPPLFGMYLAALWKGFGKTLWISHLAMLPFIFGNLVLIYQIGKYLTNTRFAYWFLAFFLVDPVLIGQSLLVSPDIVLTFFFLLSLWGIFKQKSLLQLIGVVGLCLISMRGMMISLALFLYWFFTNFKAQKNTFWQFTFSVSTLKKSTHFILGPLLALCFLIYHYNQTGWIGYHENSPWAPSFDKVEMMGFVKNIAILVWRLLDYGRIFLGLILAWLMVTFYKKPLSHTLKKLLLLSFLLTLTLLPSMLLHKGLLGHRYLIPIFILLTLLSLVSLFHYITTQRLQKLLLVGLISGLASGNIWIYPDKIAQGWDATLAHLPYYNLRQQCLQYIDHQQIPYNSIGTSFPAIGPFKFRDLGDKEDGFVAKDFQQNKYIFYSNIMNDFSDKELETLKTDWIVAKKFEKQGIKVILYQQSAVKE